MYREINPPAEILKRILFVIYVLCWMCVPILWLEAFIRGRFQDLIIGNILLLICILLKNHGERHWDFRRLARSFPMGSAEEDLPLELRQEAEDLLRAMADDGIPWTDRQELRLRLENLVRQAPRLLDIYREEFIDIHPSLLNHL